MLSLASLRADHYQACVIKTTAEILGLPTVKQLYQSYIDVLNVLCQRFCNKPQDCTDTVHNMVEEIQINVIPLAGAFSDEGTKANDVPKGDPIPPIVLQDSNTDSTNVIEAKVLAPHKLAKKPAFNQRNLSFKQRRNGTYSLRNIKPSVTTTPKLDGDEKHFEFYEIIDKFMGCFDKVRPKYVRETNTGNADDHCSSPATIFETNANPDLENVDQQGATTVMPAASKKGRRRNKEKEKEERYCRG
ncbi:hypothetical protein ACROYT_G022531 [Oculina patagonica]